MFSKHKGFGWLKSAGGLDLLFFAHSLTQNILYRKCPLLITSAACAFICTSDSFYHNANNMNPDQPAPSGAV